MKIAVATDNGTIESANNGSVSVDTLPSDNVRIDDGAVYSGEISVSVTGASSGSCEGASGVGSISPSSDKMKVDGSYVAREGDSVDILVTGATSGGSTCSFTDTVEITSAGQTSVRVE